jgi:hypothetical protein
MKWGLEPIRLEVADWRKTKYLPSALQVLLLALLLGSSSATLTLRLNKLLEVPAVNPLYML